MILSIPPHARKEFILDLIKIMFKEISIKSFFKEFLPNLFLFMIYLLGMAVYYAWCGFCILVANVYCKITRKPSIFC